MSDEEDIKLPEEEPKRDERSTHGGSDEDEIPGEPKPKRDFLKPRDYKVGLESKLGKTVVISKATPTSQAGGFYCEVCDCVVKDSINYLDHINGKKHQRNLGMSMRIKRSTLQDVIARFEFHRNKKEEKAKEYDIEERLKEVKEEEERLKEYRKEKKKKKRALEEEPAGEENDEMARIMGFKKFGSGKGSSKR